MHMDGARFANALVSLDVTPAEMTWKSGIDVLSFGATKNGCLAAEAIIFFKKDLVGNVTFLMKRAGHLLSKMRFVSAQLDAYITNDVWIKNARHANKMGKKLSDGLLVLQFFLYRSDGVKILQSLRQLHLLVYSAKEISKGSSIETKSSRFSNLLELNFKTLYLEFIKLFQGIILF